MSLGGTYSAFIRLVKSKTCYSENFTKHIQEGLSFMTPSHNCETNSPPITRQNKPKNNQLAREANLLRNEKKGNEKAVLNNEVILYQKIRQPPKTEAIPQLQVAF